MAAEWRETTLGELVEIFDGPHATPSKTEDRPIFLGISNLVNGRVDLAATAHLSEEDYEQWTRRVVPRPGDLVFSYETRLGEAALIPLNLRCCLGRRMGLLRARSGKVDKRFLLYAYLGSEFQEILRSRTIHGSTVDRIPLINMPDFPIRVPKDLGEQHAIAGVLGALDDKIELNRRMNETLETMARALFRSWFVDFDPVRAKPEGRDPGLSEPIVDLFPNRLVNSDLGEIPEGWEVRDLEGAAELVRIQANPFEMPDHVFSHYSIPAFDNGQLPLAEPGITIKSGKFCVPPGTVLFSKLNPTIERVWLVDPEPSESAICSTEFLVLRPQAPMGRCFLYCLLRSPNFREAIHSLVTGTSNSHQRARADGILQLLIGFPPAGLVRRFEELAGPILNQTLANRRQSQTLANIRDLLLPKLISGEPRVSEAERVVMAAQ